MARGTYKKLTSLEWLFKTYQGISCYEKIADLLNVSL